MFRHSSNSNGPVIFSPLSEIKLHYHFSLIEAALYFCDENSQKTVGSQRRGVSGVSRYTKHLHIQSMDMQMKRGTPIGIEQ